MNFSNTNFLANANLLGDAMDFANLTPLLRLLKPAVDGFVFGAALIFSLGPQNTLVIRTALGRNFGLTTATVGFVSEAVLVGVNGAGFASLIIGLPRFVVCASWLGVLFVGFCGLRAFLRSADAAKPGSAAEGAQNRFSAIGAMMAVTWLNPLVYVEVVLLCGLLASSYSDLAARWLFLISFLCASSVKFFGLSFAAGRFANWFARPGAPRLFDRLSGVAMLAVALSLLWTLVDKPNPRSHSPSRAIFVHGQAPTRVAATASVLE